MVMISNHLDVILDLLEFLKNNDRKNANGYDSNKICTRFLVTAIFLEIIKCIDEIT